jgi:hypothetical protein
LRVFFYPFLFVFFFFVLGILQAIVVFTTHK